MTVQMLYNLLQQAVDCNKYVDVDTPVKIVGSLSAGKEWASYYNEYDQTLYIFNRHMNIDDVVYSFEQ